VVQAMELQSDHARKQMDVAKQLEEIVTCHAGYSGCNAAKSEGYPAGFDCLL
jgi:L,D-peptidoglycan transpeptidase YkuD (ErfK/YbiS/YcfS/YnhG family)